MGLPGMGLSVPLLFDHYAHALKGQMPWEVGQGFSKINGLYTYVNDFVEYIGPSGAATTSGWVQTVVGTGTAALSSALPGGVLVLTTTAAAGDLQNLQRTVEDFKYVVGKQAGFIARVAPSIAITTVDLLFGLAVLDTSLIVSAPADGLIFRKLAAANKFSFLASKTSATTATVADIDQSDVVAEEFRYYGFVITPAGGVDIYWGKTFDAMERVGGVAAGNVGLPDTEELALSFSLRATTTSARAMLVDAVAYWREL